MAASVQDLMAADNRRLGTLGPVSHVEQLVRLEAIDLDERLRVGSGSPLPRGGGRLWCLPDGEASAQPATSIESFQDGRIWSS